MQHDRVLWKLLHYASIDDVRRRRGLEAARVLQPFRVRPRNVHCVHVTYQRPKITHFLKGGPALRQVASQAFSDAEQMWRNEVERDAAKSGEKVRERVGGPLIREITDQGNPEIVQPSDLPPDGIRVEQRLGGVLATSITTANDRRRDTAAARFAPPSRGSAGE